MKKELSHISVNKTSFFFGLMAFVFTAIIVIPMSIMEFISGNAEAGFLLLTAPFLYFIAAYIGWVIWSWIYNLVAHYVGGAVFELKDKE
ncbi:MAG: hypothetical protein KDK62_03360 [Chlamydiia bacterium]|nr:hypothetical protein [Chlamydiia bacterium]